MGLFSDNRKIAVNKYKVYMNLRNNEADFRNSIIEGKITDKEAIKFVESFLKVKINDIKLMDITKRNELLNEIISFKIIKILQISRITGIDRNILRKIEKRKAGGPKVV